VGTGINGQLTGARELLRTGKCRRTDETRVCLLGAGLRLGPHNFGHSIINQFYPERPGWIGLEHNVRWLDVAMHDTAGFCSNKSTCSLFNHIQCQGERHGSVATYTRFERFAFDQFHRVETLAILFTVICHSSHVWMTNVRGRTRFAQKTRSRARVLRHFAIDNLESNERVQNCIARAVSYRHRSGTELNGKTVCSGLYFEVRVSQWSRC